MSDRKRTISLERDGTYPLAVIPRRSISSSTRGGIGRYPQTTEGSRCHRTRSSRLARWPNSCCSCHWRFIGLLTTNCASTYQLQRDHTTRIRYLLPPHQRRPYFSFQEHYAGM